MKRYRLPPGTEPGAIPTSLILEVRDFRLTHMYGMLHAALALHGQAGPFAPPQLLALFPPQGGVTQNTAAEDLQRLAELGYIEVEYLA